MLERFGTMRCLVVEWLPPMGLDSWSSQNRCAANIQRIELEMDTSVYRMNAWRTVSLVPMVLQGDVLSQPARWELPAIDKFGDFTLDVCLLQFVA